MIVTVLIVTIACAEVLVRIMGHSPWRFQAVDLNEPTMSEYDAILGWVAKPGMYSVPPYSPAGSEIQYTFLDDGSRATSDNPQTDSYDVVLLGGSYTQGRAVSDRETFGWKLQEAFPDMNVGNFGVGAYGTYQSYLMLKSLCQRGIEPKIAIYGFIDTHEQRNIARYTWLRTISLYSKRGHIAMPYCSLDTEGRIAEHPPVAYPVIPFREQLTLVDFLTMTYYRLNRGERERFDNRVKITEAILLKMNRLARANGSSLCVAVLQASDAAQRHYARILEDEGILVIDVRTDPGSALRVRGEGHPNGKAHSLWADRIEAVLRPNIVP